MAKGRRAPRAEAIRHEVGYAGPERLPFCKACTKQMGVRIFPCRRAGEVSQLSPEQQADFYRRHNICGRCGQPANTWRSLCKCNGRCGCWDLHKPDDGPLAGQMSFI